VSDEKYGMKRLRNHLVARKRDVYTGNIMSETTVAANESMNEWMNVIRLKAGISTLPGSGLKQTPVAYVKCAF